MTASERPAPSPKGSGLSESSAATKPLALGPQSNGWADNREWSARADYARGLRRRRAAAARLPVLDDGRCDPLQAPSSPAPDERELDRWAAALLHLQSVGLAGLPPADVRCALASRADRYAAILPRRSVA